MYKVVIIDDEPWTRDVIKNLANWSEYDLEVVGEAADGETGLELIQKVSPDLIITDVCMPRLNGIELVTKLRYEKIETPVLIISGYDDYAYVHSAMKLEVTDYILKPIKQIELNEQLKRNINLLNERKQPLKNQSVRVSFLADGWEDRYHKLKGNIVSALQQSDIEILKQDFERMYEVIVKHEGETPSQATMIGIYYALIYPLQKHIETMGLKKESVFAERNTSFVFSRDNTLKQMIEFVLSLYCFAIEKIKQSTLVHLDINAVKRYLNENYLQGVTLELTADVFHVTKEYLSKAFKSATDICFSKYVISLKMDKAKELINGNKLSLKEIGAMVGYYDQAQFYKSFKQYFGKTPGEMKKRLNFDNE